MGSEGPGAEPGTPVPPPCCIACHTALTPPWAHLPDPPDTASGYQFNNALWIGFYGGYAMFVDNMDNVGHRPAGSPRVLEGSDYEAVLCHDCAHALCATNPWIAKLLRPDRSHAHRRDTGANLDGHIGWDLLPIPETGPAPKTDTCACGAAAAPILLTDNGTIIAVCSDCWTYESEGGWCPACNRYARTVAPATVDDLYDNFAPDRVRRRECVFCLADRYRGRLEDYQPVMGTSYSQRRSEINDLLTRVFTAWTTREQMTLAGSDPSDIDVVTHLAHGVILQHHTA